MIFLFLFFDFLTLEEGTVIYGANETTERREKHM